jgi:hypothetical protein
MVAIQVPLYAKRCKFPKHSTIAFAGNAGTVQWSGWIETHFENLACVTLRANWDERPAWPLVDVALAQ